MFAAYVTPNGGRAGADRPGAVPAGEVDGRPGRCRAAGIGDDAGFATKPKLAEKMIGRARDAGIPFSWVASDVIPVAAGGVRADEPGRPRPEAPHAPRAPPNRLLPAEATRASLLKEAFHRRWSDWRRRRDAAARKSRCARRLTNREALSR
jgi:hypothetical protein